MTAVDRLDEHGRPQPPVDGDEAATLVGFLEYQRGTLAWKCRDLDGNAMQTTVGASTMTLGGLLKHLAYDNCCSRRHPTEVVDATRPTGSCGRPGLRCRASES